MPDRGGVAVRPARPGDDAALLALDRGSWTPGSGFPSASGATASSFFHDHRTVQECLVAELDGAVVGCVVVQPKTTYPEAAHVFALWQLLVAPDARRRGVASALIEAAEAAAVARGARKIGLLVLSTNETALRLYARHGYLQEGRYVDEFVIDGQAVDDIALARRL